MKKSFVVILMLGFYYSLFGQSYDVTGDYTISGDVGIGTTSPNRKLTIFDETMPVISLGKNTANVVQLSYENDYGSLQSIISGYEGKLILNGGGGNVGIGTTSPNRKLTIFDETMPVISLGKNTANVVQLSYENDYGSLQSIISGYEGKLILNGGGGNVGIGTTNPQSLLAVNGTIRAKEIKVTLDGWSDFVFNAEYEFRSLTDLEKFINENNRLPDMPSEEEVIKNGVSLGEMNAKLLQKIEELTLYTIEQQKQIEKLLQQNAEIEKLKAIIEKMD